MRPSPAVLLLMAVAPAVVGCDDGTGGAGASPPQPAPVAVWTVGSTEVEVERHWSGRLEPLRTIAVQAHRGGTVAGVLVRDGDAVRPGEVLVRMEGPDLEARMTALEARRRQLEGELERWRRLAGAGAAGGGEVAAATLRLLEVQEQVSELESNRESYLIRSPADGRVHGITVGPGANVGAGQLLLEVDDGAAMGIRLVIPSAETGFLEEVERLRVRDDRGEELRLDRVAFSSDPHPAFVRADLYLAEGAAGGRRSATVIYRVTRDVLLLPWTAVASDADRDWVALLVEGDPVRVERRTVEVAGAHAGGLEVAAGVVAGDRVVRYEPRSHPEGRAVRPVERAGEERE